MDIQRGDQVYYRGEVWTVKEVYPDDPEGLDLYLKRDGDQGKWYDADVSSRQVQRVEQVR